MLIENVMYFALGALAAGLLALIVLPAVWRRAVRLTKRRIEAATPMTMAEFRADKDQLRAEFALSTRRLEMNVEQLRKRLAEQLSDVSRNQHDVASLKTERERHGGVVRELELREGQLREQVIVLERETTDLAQRLRMREREVTTKTGEIADMREALNGGLPASRDLDGNALTGDYERDVDTLMTAMAIERQRANFLEEQAKSLIARLESSDKNATQTTVTMAQMRGTLAQRQDHRDSHTKELIAAEAKIASAESRMSAILAETSQIVENSEGRAGQLLAEKLSLEDQLMVLRAKIGTVESTIMADWDTDRIEQAHLRERLNDIASDVSRLVYTIETGVNATLEEESLFDRVQRFAGESFNVEALQVAGPTQDLGSRRGKGRLSDRMAALRELQGTQ